MSKEDKSSGDALTNLLKSTSGEQPPAIHDPYNKGLLAISRGTAVILLLIYAAYLNFQARKIILKIHNSSY